MSTTVLKFKYLNTIKKFHHYKNSPRGEFCMSIINSRHNLYKFNFSTLNLFPLSFSPHFFFVSMLHNFPNDNIYSRSVQLLSAENRLKRTTSWKLGLFFSFFLWIRLRKLVEGEVKRPKSAFPLTLRVFLLLLQKNRFQLSFFLNSK